MIQIFSDGACSKNPGPGGWAAVLVQSSQVIKTVAGYDKNTTNNRMELLGAINGIHIAKNLGTNFLVLTDSIYVKDGITKWIFSWKKNNWKNGQIKNIDLWMQLSAVTMHSNIEWQWIKGHSNIEYNEMADSLAREQIKVNKIS